MAHLGCMVAHMPNATPVAPFLVPLAQTRHTLVLGLLVDVLADVVCDLGLGQV